MSFVQLLKRHILEFRFYYLKDKSYQKDYARLQKKIIQQLFHYLYHSIIIFIMAEYLHQYGNQNLGGKAPQNLQHYRIQIRKLQQKLSQTKSQYQKKIQQLSRQLKNHRKPIFQNVAGSKPSIDLDFQIFQRDNTIKQLRNENTKLRQIVNNPDHILIKKPNNFQLIAEKDNEINRLKKALQQIESRYDGQFFNEHKVKKQYEMLQKQNESLKFHLRNLQSQRKSTTANQQLPLQVLEAIGYKKQLEMVTKDNEVMRKKLMERQEFAKNKLKASQKSMELGNSRKSYALGLGTEIQALKRQIQQFKTKNRELNKQVNELLKENQKLLAEKEKTLKFSNQDTRIQVNKIKSSNNEIPVQSIINSYQVLNRQPSGSLNSNQPQPTPKKNGRYAELGVDDNYVRRLTKDQKKED